jgi:acyl-CoA synthetase (AMP-forming)/AMP-acid ligase II
MEKLGPNPANSTPLTPLGFLERAATVYGDCCSVVYDATVFTWSQTYRRCLRLASALASLGISRGDVVSTIYLSLPYSLATSVDSACTLSVLRGGRTVAK